MVLMQVVLPFLMTSYIYIDHDTLSWTIVGPKPFHVTKQIWQYYVHVSGVFEFYRPILEAKNECIYIISNLSSSKKLTRP